MRRFKAEKRGRRKLSQNIRSYSPLRSGKEQNRSSRFFPLFFPSPRGLHLGIRVHSVMTLYCAHFYSAPRTLMNVGLIVARPSAERRGGMEWVRESLRCDDGILRCELVLNSLSQSSTYPSRRSGLRCGGTHRGEHASGVAIGQG